jgi:biopolymer transport protein ExbD
MHKLKFFALFLIVASAISCTQMKTAVNIINDKPYERPKMPIADIPRDIKNATADAHLGEEKAIVVSVLPGKNLYIGEFEYPRDVLGDVIEKRLKENPSERQLIYINSDLRTEYGEIVNVLDSIRKTDVENIGLRVAPKSENERQFYILKVKIPAEPKMEDEPVKPNPYTLIINVTKDGKTTLNKQGMQVEEIARKLPEIFKDRESKGVFREGTNDVFKEITIKASRSASYRDIIMLVDAATGAGAFPVYLQIDDLEM